MRGKQLQHLANISVTNKQKELQMKALSRQFSIEQENEEKESILSRKLETIEMALKEIEIHYLRKYPKIDGEKLIPLFQWKFYKKLERIDDLLIKKDYLDPKSANVIMDEIDEHINELAQSIKREKVTI